MLKSKQLRISTYLIYGIVYSFYEIDESNETVLFCQPVIPVTRIWLQLGIIVPCEDYS